MERARIRTESLIIPTYPEPEPEALPMFAENRVHQRSSGRPYPNQVVLEANRTERTDKAYTAVHLENAFLDVWVLPEIGGRIFAATDKTTGYDFFYRQHVIKPALIGALGSWISGGVEFNWPYHHRPSGFMPCDFTTEECEDGSVICWLSEHEPDRRMKALVGIVLGADSAFLETRVKLCNRTPLPQSFLWWENAAVPVDESYQIFFPKDVTYVSFHYLDSRISYPVAGGGVYNGFDMTEPRDISWHKNTRDATSYFACASSYDFFGGYDHRKECGVVHIANHHISPGKKLFTWAYGQLSKSWERALTDTDGQYAELMAGSYTDNQPDFSWLEPYETKEFSQFWYPISRIGAPDFANLNCAIRFIPKQLAIQATKPFGDCTLQIRAGRELLLDTNVSLTPGAPIFVPFERPDALLRVSITAFDGSVLASYQEEQPDPLKMPPVKDAIPLAAELDSADDLYLAGVHVEQYRDPARMPDAYWEEALKRNPRHVPSLLGMAKYSYRMLRPKKALDYIKKAIHELTRFNAHPESGDAYYLCGLILESLGQDDEAYDYYYKASWNGSAVSKAMAHLAALDLKRGDPENARLHARESIRHDAMQPLAHAALLLAYKKAGNPKAAAKTADRFLKEDPLNLLILWLSGEAPELFFAGMKSSPAQSTLDIVFDLASMGQTEECIALLTGLFKYRPEQALAMPLYTLAYFEKAAGRPFAETLAKAETAELGRTYPFRREEAGVLRFAADQSSVRARFLLGCLLYHSRHYEDAATLFQESSGSGPEAYMARRSLAIAFYSHLNRRQEALPLMKQALSEGNTPQLLYETVVLMDKLGTSPKEKLDLLTANRDLLHMDCLFTELAKACNQLHEPQKALEILAGHTFTPCEGGEHAIAEQYMFAHYLIGMDKKKQGLFQEAADAFQTACILPDNLGAGIWNPCRYVPFQYQHAECLRELGRLEAAGSIYREILDIKEDFFTRMHLIELPCYKAMSALRLGLAQQAQRIMTVSRREWQTELTKTDSGFFSTTPFFISFVDDPAAMRKAQYLYLLALVELYQGNQKTALPMFQESCRLNSDHLFCGHYAGLY
ncbi:MAG: DUF5107 domain-containing protein [Lachnospiraceae bacterium]|nr:DUF5107 domain-containing protein [Lachnospiraceae bacterium]